MQQLNKRRPKPAKSGQYKIKNWKGYNHALKQRGSLEIWVEPLLEGIKADIEKMAGDGAYDKTKVYEVLRKKKIKPIIPPRKNARIKKHANSRGRPLARDHNIRGVRKWGRKKWKQKVKYHRRSLSETTMFRYKTVFGGKLSARTLEHQKSRSDE